MPSVARVGDTVVGVCYAHNQPQPVTGRIVSGDSSVLTNGTPTATIGSTVVFSCGHAGTIASGFGNVMCSGQIIATIGSTVSGPMTANVSSGSSNVIAGG